MQLMSSKALVEDCTFLDNSALKTNHGITMIASTLELYNSTISFSAKFADGLNKTNVDYGFFALFLGSTITIAKNSQIRNLVALNQAVLGAFSLSSVFVSENVRFLNNKATSSLGNTISLQNTGEVEIKSSHFEGNK